MEKLSNELVCMIVKDLTSRDLFSLSRASRTYWKWLQPLLYRQHALRDDRRTGSAITNVLESTDPNKPETRAMSLIILDKVAQFCHFESAVLDRCRRTTRASDWFDSGRVCHLASLCEIRICLTRHPSLSPLHVAALKGLDDIAAWLLDQGASVDAPIPGTKTTALTLAVLGNHIPTTLLLLANGADPGSRLSGRDVRDPPTVLHLVCMLGLAELADQLLTRQYLEVDPTELLVVYQLNCPSDVSGFVAVLVRHGAEVSADNFRSFLHASKWQSAWEVLTSPILSDHLVVEAASCMLRDVVSLRSEKLAKHMETVVRIMRHLLDRGADPNLGRLLWPRSGSVDYPILLKLLPPFFEAGMDVRPAPSTRRRTRRQSSVKYGVDDLLGHTSPFDESQDDEGAAAQLSVICVLLQHGALIGGATRGDALDSYLVVFDEQLDGRARWSYKLCQVLLAHSRSVPEDKRGEDINVFLDRFSKVQRRGRSKLVAGL
ncbi:hypothetical protein CEP51_012483 [Fusarium floridanum]|uniref:Uncharacterized protein n=1 Tax=Fusarium floridanum TaxID=1325733 RepID=A0A428QTB0_9HYPO|nr:hypothetical protein CEP51_012483 [Fusarium floridanum]